MFAVSLILLVILVVAVAIVLIVALPQLRSGSEILTEDGKQAVARAGQVARTGPIAVVGGTKQLLRPVSEKLHAQLDRLDERENRERSEQQQPVMFAPRPRPEESGPISLLPPAGASDGAARDVVPSRLDVVIDLRDTDRAATRPIDKPIEHRA